MFSKFRSEGRCIGGGKFLFATVFFLMLMAMGTLTALSPEIVARLLPILILVILLFLAYLNKSDQPIGDGTLKIWLFSLLAVMALWPTYMLIKVGNLPTIDVRRIAAGLSIAAMFFFIISRKPVVKVWGYETMGALKVGVSLVCIYAVWRFVSCLGSPTPLASFIMILWELIYYYSMFFVGALFFSRPSLQVWTMTIFMSLSVFISFYAGIEWMIKKNPLTQFAPSGEGFADFQRALSIERIRDGFFRAQATFEHPILLAEFSAMAVCFSVAALLWPQKIRNFRVLGAVTLIASILAALLSGSRTALVSTFAGGGVILLLRIFTPTQLLNTGQQFFRKLMFITAVIAIVAISVPVVEIIASGKTASESSSTKGRAYMLEQGLLAIEKSPLLGTGPGTAEALAGIRTGSGVTTLDNYFLAVAIESGIPALILLLACLVYPAWVIFSQLMNGPLHSPAFLAATLGCLLVTILTHIVLWMPYNMFFTYLFSGSALASISAASREKQI